MGAAVVLSTARFTSLVASVEPKQRRPLTKITERPHFLHEVAPTAEAEAQAEAGGLTQAHAKADA